MLVDKNTKKLLEQWVHDGRPDKVFKDLLDNGYRRDKAGCIALARKALDRAAEEGAEKLIRVAFQEMLRLNLGLMLRVQYLAGDQVAKWDESLAQNKRFLDEDLHRNILPALEKLQLHIVDLSKAYATIEHTLRLAAAEPTSKRESASGKGSPRKSAVAEGQPHLKLVSTSKGRKGNGRSRAAA